MTEADFRVLELEFLDLPGERVITFEYETNDGESGIIVFEDDDIFYDYGDIRFEKCVNVPDRLIGTTLNFDITEQVTWTKKCSDDPLVVQVKVKEATLTFEKDPGWCGLERKLGGGRRLDSAAAQARGSVKPDGR